MLYILYISLCIQYTLECREDKHLNGIVRSEVMGIKVLIDVAKLFPQRFQQCLPTLHPQ